MADLVRTDDADAEPEGDGGDEEAAGRGAFVVAKGKRAVFQFEDLGSGDEDEREANKKARPWEPDTSQGRPTTGWNFDSHQTKDDDDEEEEVMGLQAKITARLAEKEGAGKKKKKLKKKRGDGQDEVAQADVADGKDASAEVEKQAPKTGTANHLKTDKHFADLRLSRPLLRAVSDLKYETPTPIQRDVVPPALSGLDVLATAETGSGKTASFLLPILERLLQSPNVRTRKYDNQGRMVMGHVATKAMILIPTRELAVQCHAMLRDLAKHTMVTYQLVAGGYVSQDQASSLRKQPDIVVATPGRLLDHLLNSHSVHMELLEIVVFDEADRLLEMGFREECMQVLQRCSRGRQTMLFSATLNPAVEDLASLAMVKPVRVHASAANRVVETLEQEFVKSPSEELREAVLLSLVTRNYRKSVIIFCATRKAAHRLAIVLGLAGLRFTEIHGNLQQAERVQALQTFQAGKADFLVATDLAARGLDLQNVETVINFHLPLDTARYIHRVGRTARMGRGGRAVTIYCDAEYSKVKALGKQVCTNMKSKVLKRNVATDVVQQMSEKIEAFADDVQEILDEETMEREMSMSDRLLKKSQNLEKYKGDIKARPQRQWIMDNIDKRKQKEADNERVKLIGEEGPPPEVEGKKGKRSLTEEEVSQRRKSAAQQKHKRKREEEVNQRNEDEKRIRAMGRRVRKVEKTPKLHNAAAHTPKKEKKKKNKKKGKGKK